MNKTETIYEDYTQLLEVSGENIYLLKNLTGIVFREEELQYLFELFSVSHGEVLCYKNYNFYKLTCAEQGSNAIPTKIGDFYSVIQEALSKVAVMLMTEETYNIEELKKIQLALNSMKDSMLTKEMVYSLSAGTLAGLMRELEIANHQKYVVIDKFKSAFINYCDKMEWRFQNWIDAYDSFKEIAVNAYVDSFLNHWNEKRDQGMSLAVALESYFAA